MGKALVTGICGQDGSYLAELLLDRGYDVVGLTRRVPDPDPTAHLRSRITVVEGDVRDARFVADLVAQMAPDELYNLAAPSFVPDADPVGVAGAAAVGAASVLDAVARRRPDCRVYQASSSEIFGHPAEVPQNETTPFRPRNAYGAAKLHAHWLVAIARESGGLHASSGILYNHDSPRRDPSFVTRRISLGAARIAAGLETTLTLGDLDARRDWGFAGDYVEAMWAMLQRDEPGDLVVCTGVTHSVADICEMAFSRLGLDWRDHVRSDAGLSRGDQADVLVGDPTRARTTLGWSATVALTDLVAMMVDADVERVASTARGGAAAPGTTR